MGLFNWLLGSKATEDSRGATATVIAELLVAIQTADTPRVSATLKKRIGCTSCGATFVMLDGLDHTRGSLNCPKCGHSIGSFPFMRR
jgi:DNA-directed RNA polymerase subunit RPC12/RpoP